MISGGATALHNAVLIILYTAAITYCYICRCQMYDYRFDIQKYNRVSFIKDVEF